MTGYRTVKTTLGHRIRIRMSRREIIERRVFAGAIALLPLALFGLFTVFARMV